MILSCLLHNNFFSRKRKNSQKVHDTKHFGQRAFSHYCYEPTRKNVRSVVDGNELYVAIGSSANNLFLYSYHESDTDALKRFETAAIAV